MSQSVPSVLLACPNPLCEQRFANNELVCNHLVEPGTFCSQWSNNFINNYIYRQSQEQDADEFLDSDGIDDPGM